MTKNDVGINAGIIWRLLDEKGALTIAEILKHTEFSSEYMFAAIGWLLREDKIIFFEKDDNEYVILTDAHYSEMYF